MKTRDTRYQQKWRDHGLKPVQVWTDEKGEKEVRKHDRRAQVRKMIEKRDEK